MVVDDVEKYLITEARRSENLLGLAIVLGDLTLCMLREEFIAG